MDKNSTTKRRYICPLMTLEIKLSVGPKSGNI